MQLEKVLRLSIIAEITLTASSIATQFLLVNLLPPELRVFDAQRSARHNSGLTIIPRILYILVLILSIVSWVKLWRLDRDGRALYTTAWACSIPIIIPLGPFIHSGLGYAIDTTSSVVGGFILGILYFSDLRSRFK